MALVAVPMTCGNGTRFTDSFGGCNSFAQSLVGTNAYFRGPKFSMFGRVKLVNAALSGFTGRVGISIGAGGASPIRQYINLTVTATQIHFIPILDTTACGFQIVADQFIPKDTNEHSWAWTYDQAGLWKLYVDGAQVDGGAAVCADISGPATAGDIYAAVGNIAFDGTEVFNMDRLMYSNGIAPASQIASIHGDCMAF